MLFNLLYDTPETFEYNGSTIGYIREHLLPFFVPLIGDYLILSCVRQHVR